MGGAAVTNTSHNSKYDGDDSDESSDTDSDASYVTDSDDGEGGGVAEALFLESVGCKRLMTDVLEELKVRHSPLLWKAAASKAETQRRSKIGS